MPLTLKRDRNSGIYYVRGTVTVWKRGRSSSVEVFKSTRTRDKAEADAIRLQIENAAKERNHTGKEPALSFKQASERYKKAGGGERFLEKVENRLGPYPVDEITQSMLDDAALAAYPKQADATRRRQFYAPAIAVMRSAGVSTLFRRAPDGQKRTVFMRPDQAEAFIKAVVAFRWENPWMPALATFLFCHGARVKEALSIDGRDDVSLEHGYVMLRNTKNGKERMVSLCQRSRAALSTIPNVGDPGPLFLRYDGRPYAERNDAGNPLRWWKTAVERAELPPFTPHVARHSWATWHYSLYRDVVRLKSEGGWESQEWERYVKLSSPSLGDAAVRYKFLDVEKPWSGSVIGSANVG